VPLKIEKPQAYDYINHEIKIAVSNDETKFEINISADTLDDVFGLDGKDTHSVLGCVTANWVKIENAIRRRYEGRDIIGNGGSRLLPQDFN
jgi:hypothetical protein